MSVNPPALTESHSQKTSFSVAVYFTLSLWLAVAADAQLAYWPLDDGSGTIADDISSEFLDGAIQGAGASPQWLAAGVLDGALELDGVDDLVTVQDAGTSPLDLVTQMTLALWVRPASLSGNRSLMSKDGVFELDLNRSSAGSYSVRLENTQRGQGNSTLVADAWQHVAVTWDGTTVKYYFQGQADGTASFIGALPLNDKDFGLGGRPPGYSGGSPQFLLDGAIDDARIYDRALSEAEILAVSQNQPLPNAPADTAPPIRSNGGPTGTFAFGTAEAEMTLLTDEVAECRYADAPGTAWPSMVGLFDITGGTFHSETITGLQDGFSYQLYIRCRDSSLNDNPDDYLVAFDLEAAPPIDLTPPLLSSPSPIGTVAPDTSQVDLTVVTDEDAECRYSETPGTDFTSMVDAFQVTGGQNHSSLIIGLQNATTRIFQVRCRDLVGNANDQDTQIGFWVAEPPPGSGFHPSDLPEVEFFVESRHGFDLATCNTEACRQAGENAPLAQQFCHTDIFPNGCVRRWEDQATYSPPVPFEQPEWTTGHDFGQDDLDKPGLILNCLNGRPCVRGGVGDEQFRGFEIEPNQAIGPHTGPFSLYVLAKPIAQLEDSYYLGYAGTELIHQIADNSLRLRIGFGTKLQLTGPNTIPLNQWHLIEIHRDVNHSVTAIVDGHNLTHGNPVVDLNLYFRFLFSVSRGRAFLGDMAATMVATGELTPTEQIEVRQYFATVYGLTVGDGSVPEPGQIELPEEGLIAKWTFDDGTADCVSSNEVTGGASAISGPTCPLDSPADDTGLFGTALTFDGNNDQEVVGADPSLDLLNEITISAWVKTTNTDGYRSILDKRDASKDGFDLYMSPGGKPFFRINDKALQGHAEIADGQWHHLLGLFDGYRMKLYVDGQLDRSRVAGSQTLDTQSPLVIGRSYAGTFSVLDGSVDQIRIYDRALNTEEIGILFDE